MVPSSLVIVGGGLGGYSLADALRRKGYDGAITIIDREPALYDRPPLSKEAFVGELTLDAIGFAAAEQLAEQRIGVIAGHAVVAIDPDRLAATLDDGRSIAGDALVLATGGRARLLSFRGNDAPIVHVLRTFADATGIRAAAKPGGRALIVGAGLIGAELTSSLRALGVAVTLIDPVETPLVPVVGQTIAGVLHRMHAAHGVDVRVATLSAVEQDATGLWAAVLSDGDRIPVDLVVVGAGIVPNVELAETAGLEIDGGIVVDPAYRTSATAVHAIGDSARTRGADGTLHRREEHWEAAQLDGQELAAILLGEEPAPRGAPWWWSDRYGVHVEGVGRMSGSGELVLRDPVGGGHPAGFLVDGGLLVGAVSIDDPNVVRAARRIIDQRIPVTAAQLADPSVSLRALLRGSVS